MSEKVNILGTDYEMETRKWDDDRKLHDANGYIELYSKKMIICELNPDCLTVEKLSEKIKQTKRHEIGHAFLYESGMRHYCEDETLVDWLSIMIPKMVKVMQEVGAMPDADS